jgi:trehalose 6-phosphate synthase
MKQILTVFVVVFAVITLIAIAFTLNQVNQESARLENDMQYRSSLLADGLKESVEPNFINKSDTYLQTLVEKYANRQRIAGIAVVDNKGTIVAVSSSLPKEMSQPEQIATNVMDADKADGEFVTYNGKKLYVYAQPLHDKKSVVGSLLVVQNAAYIDSRLFDIWTGNAVRIILQVFLISLAILLFLRWLIYKPMQNLVESLRQERLTKGKKPTNLALQSPLFRPILKEFSHVQQNLIQARLAASEEAKASLEKLDSPWTAERLKQFTKDLFKNRTIIAVSNLEPYIHTKTGNTISYHIPASGLITAIEPVMQACSGIWIAQGSGNADKLVVDEQDKISVPPEEPKYVLKRVWLTGKEIQGFSYGLSDRALYPLFHMAHTRPVFNADDWKEYKNVNRKFANAILAEIKHLKKPIIFIQDFQFTLVPKLVKEQRPDATIGLFWHIPWVSAESFSICPWKKEIVDGMLGADLIGFHTQLHCNNFIETVSREVETLIDYEQSTITRHAHTSLVKPFPISIAFTTGEKSEENEREKPEVKELLKSLGIHTKYIGIGVDRLDYIKGIMDRFTAIEIFFDTYPSLQEQMTFIQISSPSETKSKQYMDFVATVEKEVERINTKFKTKNWKPIVFLPKHHSHKELIRYYKIADFCLITSLHDGMNLVCKEYVAARNDEKGVVILSQFAGAAKELKDALITNPYNGQQTADAIYTALQMSPAEQAKRMKKMRTVVRNYNIYRWSAEFMKTLMSLE